MCIKTERFVTKMHSYSEVSVGDLLSVHLCLRYFIFTLCIRCNCRNVPPLYTFICCIYICTWINKPLLYVKVCLFNSLLSLQVHCNSIFFCRVHCSVYLCIWYHRKKLMKCQTVEHLGGSDTVICTLLLAVFIIVFSFCFVFHRNPH